ncbi:kinase non-catalytic C-lobe domain-containing protein 1 isoform X4 [Scyliorhinus canicula]|uniref:kinase non-catalytic C-lobe domain-containing protein 1 isoform X4 n=1 Tax=Scyliorhinus canicula TaxID=7830 RepID=UPI0018F7B2A6|nr:kinase non-catalytic C-lobe domain-containing protein 1 isoform X4 [Scyliorhinus canicula]
MMALCYEEDDEREYYEFEPLPTLLEDEENVSLADILSLRDSCLTEQDIWAACRECCHSMKSISHTPLFHTLCITPDTLAFNANGNVCFMEQLSDDPEGAFVPPEFDITGNTFEAHVYSLGATLAAAAEYVIEPELEPNLSEELRSLLDQMQREKPEERPDIEGILNTCEEKLKCSSSDIICRNLSAIGRRVLSIESVGALQDGCEETYKEKKRQEGVGHELQTSERNPADGSSSTEDLPYDLNVLNNGTTDVICKAEKCVRDVDPDSIFEADKIFQPSSDSMASVEICERREAVLTIGPEETTVDVKIKGHEADRISPVPQKRSTARKRMLPKLPTEMVGSAQHLHRSKMELSRSSMSNLSPVSFSDTAAGSLSSLDSTNLLSVTDCRQKYISLEELLSEDDRPLKDHELWALCYECLISLQLCKDYPEYLCLESAYIDTSGEVLFLSPTNNGNLDSFYLAPEFEKQGAVTEKACIYGIAAILWAAAKFNAPVNQKLPLSRNLKNLLLDMAKRNSTERPSITDAMEICNNYLIKRGICSREILILLRNSVIQNYQKQGMDVIRLNCKTEVLEFAHSPLGNTDFAQESSGTGFVPLASDSKLTAVKGPIPCQYSVNSKSPSKLPEAFTSPATHFKPIILTQHKEKTSSVKVSSKNPTTKQLVKAMKDKNQGAAPIEDIKSNAVVKASAVNFESFESSTRPSATLVTSPVQTKISSISSVNHSTVAGSKTNPSQTISSQHQKINCDSGSSAISTFPINNEHLLQNSKTRIRTSPTAQLTVPEQATVMPSTPGCELNRHSPEPMILSEMHCSRISEISLNSIRSQLQNPSNPTLDGYENQTPNMKMYTLSESPNSSFKEFVDFDSVASVISLSETCYFAQEILDTGNEIKPLTAVANITAEVSENVHLPSACISSCCHDNLMAITSSSPAPISLLQKAVHLIKEEFAFDGYLENGEEAHAMGEYILSLKSLKFSTFNSAISEKFYDLYWDDKLLEQLYEVVNGNPPPPAPLPEATTRPNPDYFNPTLQNTMKKKKTVPGHGKQRSSDDNWEKAVDLEAREISRKPHLSSTALSERIVLDVNCLSDNLYSAKCKEDQLLSNVKMILGQDTRNMVPDDTDFKQPKSDNCEEEEKVAKHFYQMEDSCNFTGEGCNPSQDLKLNPSNEEKKEGTDQTTEGSESLVSESLRHMESNIGKKRCNPGWSSAFFGIEYFNQQVKTCVKQLGQHNFNEGDKIETKLLELEQQLNMETKNFRKTKVFYQKLQLQEKRNKGVDAKVVLPKLKQQLEEMRQKVEFLELAKKYLEILQMEQWGLRPSVLLSLVSLSFQSETLDLTSTDSNSHLTFHTLKGDQSQSKKGTQVLQAGTAVGLMAYLYSSNAVKDGYVQQFFYTFRYFTSPCEFLQFLEDRINSVIDISVTKKCTADCTKVYNRSLDLLQAWIEECYNVDFAQDTEVLHKLKTFISSKAMQLDSRGQYLINLLHNFSEKKKTCTDVSFSLEDMKNEEDNQSVHSLSKKVLDGDISRKSFKWKISKRTEPSSPHQKEKYYNTATALPKSCSNSFATELSGAYQKVDEKGLFMLADYSPQHIAQQLTLLQQELFQDCHPVHFLNSRAFGVKDKPITVRKSASSEISFIEGSSLFVPECKHQYLLDLIRYADNVSHWVSAEIVTCDTPKAQHAQLSKFLSIAKICYELRNFATAMQILSSLGSLIVRQLPSWKSLSSKALEITEELTAVQVFLKSDSLCLMEGDSFSKQPTMPCAHILAMHVQQLEIGAFTMANGTYKWPKLRKIAMVVSQIRAFQEKPYVFTPDLDLQAHLRQQITNFSEVDIHVLAAENKTNFYQSSTEWHSRKIQDALRKVKATFQ